MTRTLRYLRIAFSVTCGIAWVLLVLLWVRSYWWLDAVTTAPNHFAASLKGKLSFDTIFFEKDRPYSLAFAMEVKHLGGTGTTSTAEYHEATRECAELCLSTLDQEAEHRRNLRD